MKKNIFLVLLLLLIVCSASIFYFSILKYQNENPRIEWEQSSDTVIISYERRYDTDYNYIPAFRVWGDGYIVWVEYTSEGKRKILEGYLSQNELMVLLEKFGETDFFKYCYKNQSYALDYISINFLKKSCSSLIDENGTVNPNYEAISDLVDLLASGAGVEGKEYTPTMGYLSIVRYEKTEYYQNQPTIQAQFIWPTEEFGYTIDDIPTNNPDVREKEIVGDELLFIWDIVNSSMPFVESNGKVYWITLSIPKISTYDFTLSYNTP